LKHGLIVRFCGGIATVESQIQQVSDTAQLFGKPRTKTDLAGVLMGD